MKLSKDKLGSFQIAFILFVFIASLFLSKELFDGFIAKASFNILGAFLGYFVSTFFNGLNKLQLALIFIMSFVLFAASVYYLTKADTKSIEVKVDSLRGETLDFVGEWETKNDQVNFKLQFLDAEEVILSMSPDYNKLEYKYLFNNDCISFLDVESEELRIKWCLNVKEETFFNIVEEGDTVTFYKKH